MELEDQGMKRGILRMGSPIQTTFGSAIWPCLASIVLSLLPWATPVAAQPSTLRTTPKATGVELKPQFDIPVTGNAISMTMREDILGRPFLDIAAEDGGCLIYEISPTPTLVGTIPVGSLGSLHVMNLFQSGLRLIDVHDPVIPVELGRFANPALNGKPRAFNNLVLDGRLANVIVDYCGFEVLDVSRPAAITLVSWWNPWNPELSGWQWFSSPGHAKELAFDSPRKLVFMAAGRTDLQVLSVADPARPVPVGGFGEVGDKLGTWGVSLSGDRVYLAYIRTLGIPLSANWTGIKALRFR